jgi:crotonobetainyl-CoA:carnitine CoA-transferase CaiB-like acyl-CoA transferase
VSELPLAGLRVLDFTHAAAGPFATMLLADIGAEVVKLERPQTGDGARTMGSPMPGFPPRNSEYYLALNRNKRGVAVDLSRPEAVDLARRLADRSDIVAENFRPGVMDRLGLGFDALRRRERAGRGGLVYASISAFGDDGPWAARPANDIIMQSVSGLMGVTGEVGGGPVRIGAPVSDYSAGLFAVAGILAAVIARDRHPEGQHVEISMLEASLNLLCNYVPSVVDLDAEIPRLGRGHAQIVPYQAFPCSDGEYVMVGAFTRQFWQNLARAVGHEEWIEDERYKANSLRLRHRDQLVGELEAIFRTRPRAEWLTILDAADVPASPVLELHDTVRLEQVTLRDSIVTLQEGDRTASVVRSPIRNRAWPEPAAGMAPDLGRDTETVLRDLLGVGDEELEDLMAAGVIDSVNNRGGTEAWPARA